MSQARPIVVAFGGTFNPVHNGHLQSALELKRVLSADELRFIPCHRPPHRDQPDVSSEHRLAMVQLAIEGVNGLKVDDRELRRDALSYTVDTLTCLREELGESATLCWVMGTDAFAKIDSWHRWQALLSLAHIIVITRPGEQLSNKGVVADWLAKHQLSDVESLKRTPHGGILLQTLTPYPISSTAIRDGIKIGASQAASLPPSVLNYIEQHHLYA